MALVGEVDPCPRRLGGVVETEGRRVDVRPRAATPAEPNASASPERRLERGYQAADVALPRVERIGRRAQLGQAVGDDQQTVGTGRAEIDPGNLDTPWWRERLGVGRTAPHGEHPPKEPLRFLGRVESPVRGGRTTGFVADEHRFVLGGETTEHVLVGHVVAQRQKARARACPLAKPCDGAPFSQARRPHFQHLRSAHLDETRVARKPGGDAILDLDHGALAALGCDGAEVKRDRPRLAFDAGAGVAGGQGAKLLRQAFHLLLRGLGPWLQGTRVAAPSAVLRDEQQVPGAREEPLERFPGAAAHHGHRHTRRGSEIRDQCDELGARSRALRRRRERDQRAVQVDEDGERRPAREREPVIVHGHLEGMCRPRVDAGRHGLPGQLALSAAPLVLKVSTAPFRGIDFFGTDQWRRSKAR